MVYSSYTVSNILVFVCTFLTGYALTASAMLVNDVVDLEVDKVNKPWKPLPSGKASPKVAAVLAIALFTVGVFCNLLVSTSALLVALIYGAVGVCYSYLRRHWWSSKLVAFSTTGPVCYGYAVAGFPRGVELFTALFAVAIFLVTLGREVLKSIQDYRGDLLKGYRTVATVYGLNTAYRVMLVLGLLGALTGLSTLLLQGLSLLYKVLITLASVIYTLSIVNVYVKRGDANLLEKHRKRTLHAMTIGVAAFWFSKIPL